MLKYFSTIIFVVMTTLAPVGRAQTGNHAFGGAEADNFGVVDLSTPGGQTWSTERAAIPGYFSAAGNAIYSGAADGTANIDGYVKYYAQGAPATSFLYPVGQNADLRMLTISGIIPSTAEYAAAWISGDPGTALDPTSTGAASGVHAVSSLELSLAAVSPVGQWDWQDLSNNASGVIVTVSIPDVSNFTPVAARLRLVGWNGTQWINLSIAQGNAAATGLIENSTLTGTMQSGITAIGIGTVNVPKAVNDSITTIINTPFNGNAATNDTCSGSGPCSYGISNMPAHGSIIINTDGTYTYTPNLGYIGTDSFFYTICDSNGFCDTARILIRVEAPLPIDLKVFTAMSEDYHVALNWTTIRESNSLGFALEHSADGNNWKRLAFVASQAYNGQSSFELHYSYNDLNPLTGNNFYRLKQLDFDGDHTYSDVRLVKFAKTGSISIYPNPAHYSVTIRGLSGDETITLTDLSGRVMNKLEGNGDEQITIDISSLSEGIFQLKVESSSNITIKKIIKIKN